MAEQEKLIMANKTVLVIEDEDNEMNMKLARSLLKLGGYEVLGLILIRTRFSKKEYRKIGLVCLIKPNPMIFW